MLFDRSIWLIILEIYLLFIILYFLIKFLFSSKRVLGISLVFVLFIIIWYFSGILDLVILKSLLDYIFPLLPVIYFILIAPDIRRSLDIFLKASDKQNEFMIGSVNTKNQILDAVMFLSKEKIGALITIEKHNSLEQYAERAVTINSKVSKELIINIFAPRTPLHDGALIIRGDQILCAGAYYVLSDNEKVDNSMGSRHRAGLGISEITDSLTIIVSEETGNISIAVEGILVKGNDREKVQEYFNTFMK